MNDFTGKTALITGASSGIGEALARVFAAEGADLVLLARRLDRLEELATTLRQSGRSVWVFRCDVTQDGEMEAIVRAIESRGGKIDVVVANAGFGVAGALQKLSLEDYRRQFETNVFGVLRTVYATLGLLRASGGRLAIVGSVAGHVALPGASAYAMSKAAVRALADSLHGELAPQGIGVTLLSPGFVDSEIRRVDNRGRLHSEVSDPVPCWIRVPAETAAREMVQAIYRRKRERVITGHGKAIVFIHRHAPWLFRLLTRLGRARARPEPC